MKEKSKLHADKRPNEQTKNLEEEKFWIPRRVECDFFVPFYQQFGELKEYKKQLMKTYTRLRGKTATPKNKIRILHELILIETYIEDHQ